MRVWQGPVLPKVPVLGTAWHCVHCSEEFRCPVADELGRQRCFVHPGQVGTDSCYTCCGRSALDQRRGCRRCDHVPDVVWRAATGPDRALYVPTYILANLDGATRVPPDQVPAYRAALERRARREPRWWASLPSEVTRPVFARAEEHAVRHAEGNASLARDYGFTPFIASPEERAQKAKTKPPSVASADAVGLVDFLVRAAGDTFAWEQAPSDTTSAFKARELRQHAVEWACIPLLSLH